MKKNVHDRRRILGKDYNIWYGVLPRCNGQKEEVLEIENKESQTRVVFKFQDYYDIYREAGNILKCVMELQEHLEKSLLKNEASKRLEEILTDWERVKNAVYPTLCNTEWNKEFLEKVPHRKLMDLSVTYYVQLEDVGMEQSTMAVNQNMLEMWKVDETTIYLIAMENQQKYPSEPQNLSDILKIGDLMEDIPFKGKTGMYVLTNKNQNYGSGEILNMQTLKEFSKKMDSGLYLIPSSVHEFILIPDNGDIDIKEINTMIQEVNQTVVQKDEMLSDYAYYFDKETLDLKMCISE